MEATFELLNLRERLPALAPTTVANMTAPVLSEVAAQLVSAAPVPQTLVLSGLLPAELDDIAAAFAPPASRGATAASTATGPPSCSGRR